MAPVSAHGPHPCVLGECFSSLGGGMGIAPISGMCISFGSGVGICAVALCPGQGLEGDWVCVG